MDFCKGTGYTLEEAAKIYPDQFSKQKSSTRKASTTPKIKTGAKVLFCGREGVVVGKHPTTKGWWIVEIDGVQTSGDRSLIKAL